MKQESYQEVPFQSLLCFSRVMEIDRCGALLKLKFTVNCEICDKAKAYVLNTF